MLQRQEFDESGKWVRSWYTARDGRTVEFSPPDQIAKEWEQLPDGSLKPTRVYITRPSGEEIDLMLRPLAQSEEQS